MHDDSMIMKALESAAFSCSEGDTFMGIIVAADGLQITFHRPSHSGAKKKDADALLKAMLDNFIGVYEGDSFDTIYAVTSLKKFVDGYCSERMDEQ